MIIGREIARWKAASREERGWIAWRAFVWWVTMALAILLGAVVIGVLLFALGWR